MKTCRRCEVEKPDTEFRGQRRACRPCERIEKNAARTTVDRAPVVGVDKTCSKCEETKPCEEFSTDRRSLDGRHGWCNACARTKATIRRRERPELHRGAVSRYKAARPEATRDAFREYDVQRRFGISAAEYDERRAATERCGVCGTEDPGVRGWVLDHCHASGNIREFVCCTCNLVLGLFKDSPDRFLAAAMYLMRHQGTLSKLLPGMAEE